MGRLVGAALVTALVWFVGNVWDFAGERRSGRFADPELLSRSTWLQLDGRE